MRNLKKVISSVAAIAIVASSASAFAVTFPDVDSSASYANAVDALVALKIVNGDDKGLFNPDNNVTRAEFTKMAVGALGEIAAAEAQTGSEFTDAANTSQHWAAGYIAQGVADGFINGMGDGTFAPDSQVTYAQASKMLVAAVGYTTYAEAAGGWPSGYVSQASSLGITKGVSATNDTALTRAQCAIMIYNAMQVPLCVITEWETQTTLTGTVQTPKLEKLDGFSKKAKDYQTLLTDKHDAYLVKGRVTVTPIGGSSAVKKDEVKYRVEVSDNFDDKEYTAKDSKNKNYWEDKVKFGETNAPNMQFAYTEALIQKDTDSDTYTMLSITNYGNPSTVEFKADDLADEKDEKNLKIVDGYVDYMGYGKLPVLKNSSSSSTTKYDLDTDRVKMYVNGQEVNKTGALKNEDIKKYILDNTTGTVVLVDETDIGSTSTDGKYDEILVSFYVDAVVDYISSSSSSAKVYFKDADKKAAGENVSRMEWDPDGAELDVTFTKDGAKIDYTDLKEFDILSIQYDVVNNKHLSELGGDGYANVLVSSNSVTGDATSKDETDETVTVAGTKYDVNKNMVTVKDKSIELGTEYTLYLDAFGYVAHKEDGSSEKNYGVIVAMYKSNGDDYRTVRLITSDAKVVAYECKSDDEAKAFYDYATKGQKLTDDEKDELKKSGDLTDTTFTKKGIAKNIKAGKTVCTYKITNGKIRFNKEFEGFGEEGLEYKANSSKVGPYSISDAASKLIDMDDYMNNDTSSVSTLSVADFEDEATYDAYFFDKNSDSVYRFGIVFSGTSSIRPETQLAVVAKVNGQKDNANGDTCASYTVYRANQEVELLIEEGDVKKSDGNKATIGEGSVIAYTLGSDGYAETKNVYVLYTPENNYEGNLTNILANDNFSKKLDWVKEASTDPDDKNYGKYKIDYNNGKKTKKDVFAYLGVVYKKQNNTLELFKNKESVEVKYTDNEGKEKTRTASNASLVKNTADLSLGSATGTYTYDYSKRLDKGVRVEVGTASQTNSTFNQIFVNDKNAVDWDLRTDDKGKLVATPMTAFVKEVDGDVTDVVLFIAD